jgi:hypothetical protein
MLSLRDVEATVIRKACQASADQLIMNSFSIRMNAVMPVGQ